MTAGSISLDRVSIAVELARLRSEAETRGRSAYLLTVSEDGRPHVVALEVTWDEPAGDPDRVLLVAKAGRSSAANIAARGSASVLWPASEPGGYALILDAAASVVDRDDDVVAVLAPERAVLHRTPGGAGDEPTCIKVVTGATDEPG